MNQSILKLFKISVYLMFTSILLISIINLIIEIDEFFYLFYRIPLLVIGLGYLIGIVSFVKELTERHEYSKPFVLITGAILNVISLLCVFGLTQWAFLIFSLFSYSLLSIAYKAILNLGIESWMFKRGVHNLFTSTIIGIIGCVIGLITQCIETYYSITAIIIFTSIVFILNYKGWNKILDKGL